jgi:TonB-dependent starch-binding outer membrane protein SusC
LDSVSLRAAWGRSGGLGALHSDAALFGPIDPGSASVRPAPERRTDYELGLGAHLTRRVRVTATYVGSRMDHLHFAFAPFGSGRPTAVDFNAAIVRSRSIELGVRALLLDRTAGWQWHADLLAWRSRATLADFTMRFGAPSITLGGAAGAAVPAQVLTSGVSFGEFRPGGFNDVAPRAEAQPSWLLSLHQGLSRGPLRLRAQLDWRAGGKMVGVYRFLTDVSGSSPDYDQPAPNGIAAPLGEWRRNQVLTPGVFSSYVTSSAYLRLRDASLRLALPTRLLPGALRGTAAGVSVQGRNLWVSSRSWASDPEFNRDGAIPLIRAVDGARYPLLRQLFVGLDVGL